MSESSLKLYNFLLNSYWDGSSISGPDPGLMLNLRLTRFVKSYFPALNYKNNNHVFQQIQGYWIKNNWALYRLTNDLRYKELALKCSDFVVASQQNDGSWKYPLTEWKSRVSTVEGTWASLGLLETYSFTKNPVYLKSALNWRNFLVTKTGFQRYKDSMTINYFNIRTSRKVPNNTTLALFFFAELFNVTQDTSLLKYNDALIHFIELCQQPGGELVYEVDKTHYLCYHYNSFEFLDLYYANQILKSKRIDAILSKLSKYIASGVLNNGAVKYDCSQAYPEEIMFSAIAGAALIKASKSNYGNFKNHIDSIFRYLEKNQKSNGSFILTMHDMPYIKKPLGLGIFSDKTLYPGPMCFILSSLLTKDSENF
jgi:hypothetical protein